MYSSSAEALLKYMLHDTRDTAVKLKNRRDARSWGACLQSLFPLHCTS